eukprot:Clim_evm52s146 gene=Clim_evmTU52s146
MAATEEHEDLTPNELGGSPAYLLKRMRWVVDVRGRVSNFGNLINTNEGTPMLHIELAEPCGKSEFRPLEVWLKGDLADKALNEIDTGAILLLKNARVEVNPESESDTSRDPRNRKQHPWMITASFDLPECSAVIKFWDGASQHRQISLEGQGPPQIEEGHGLPSKKRRRGEPRTPLSEIENSTRMGLDKGQPQDPSHPQVDMLQQQHLAMPHQPTTAHGQAQAVHTHPAPNYGSALTRPGSMPKQTPVPHKNSKTVATLMKVQKLPTRARVWIMGMVTSVQDAKMTKTHEYRQQLTIWDDSLSDSCSLRASVFRKTPQQMPQLGVGDVISALGVVVEWDGQNQCNIYKDQPLMHIRACEVELYLSGSMIGEQSRAEDPNFREAVILTNIFRGQAAARQGLDRIVGCADSFTDPSATTQQNPASVLQHAHQTPPDVNSMNNCRIGHTEPSITESGVPPTQPVAQMPVAAAREKTIMPMAVQESNGTTISEARKMTAGTVVTLSVFIVSYQTGENRDHRWIVWDGSKRSSDLEMQVSDRFNDINGFVRGQGLEVRVDNASPSFVSKVVVRSKWTVRGTIKMDSTGVYLSVQDQSAMTVLSDADPKVKQLKTSMLKSTLEYFKPEQFNHIWNGTPLPRKPISVVTKGSANISAYTKIGELRQISNKTQKYRVKARLSGVEHLEPDRVFTLKCSKCDRLSLYEEVKDLLPTVGNTMLPKQCKDCGADQRHLKVIMCLRLLLTDIDEAEESPKAFPAILMGDEAIRFFGGDIQPRFRPSTRPNPLASTVCDSFRKLIALTGPHQGNRYLDMILSCARITNDDSEKDVIGVVVDTKLDREDMYNAGL